MQYNDYVIRSHMFETNSSSCHSIVVCNTAPTPLIVDSVDGVLQVDFDDVVIYDVTLSTPYDKWVYLLALELTSLDISRSYQDIVDEVWQVIVDNHDETKDVHDKYLDCIYGQYDSLTSLLEIVYNTNPQVKSIQLLNNPVCDHQSMTPAIGFISNIDAEYDECNDQKYLYHRFKNIIENGQIKFKLYRD